MSSRLPLILGLVVGGLGVGGLLTWVMWPEPPPPPPELSDEERTRQETEDHMRSIGYVQ